MAPLCRLQFRLRWYAQTVLYMAFHDTFERFDAAHLSPLVLPIAVAMPGWLPGPTRRLRPAC